MAASEAAARRSGPQSRAWRQLFRKQFHKTKLCRFYPIGECRYGDDCPYAHDQLEIEYTPDLTKTALCVEFDKGLCMKSSDKCPYAHGREELRTTDAFSSSPMCKRVVGGGVDGDEQEMENWADSPPMQQQAFFQQQPSSPQRPVNPSANSGDGSRSTFETSARAPKKKVNAKSPAKALDLSVSVQAPARLGPTSPSAARVVNLADALLQQDALAVGMSPPLGLAHPLSPIGGGLVGCRQPWSPASGLQLPVSMGLVSGVAGGYPEVSMGLVPGVARGLASYPDTTKVSLGLVSGVAGGYPEAVMRFRGMATPGSPLPPQAVMRFPGMATPSSPMPSQAVMRFPGVATPSSPMPSQAVMRFPGMATPGSPMPSQVVRGRLAADHQGRSTAAALPQPLAPSYPPRLSPALLPATPIKERSHHFPLVLLSLVGDSAGTPTATPGSAAAPISPEGALRGGVGGEGRGDAGDDSPRWKTDPAYISATAVDYRSVSSGRRSVCSQGSGTSPLGNEVDSPRHCWARTPSSAASPERYDSLSPKRGGKRVVGLTSALLDNHLRDVFGSGSMAPGANARTFPPLLEHGGHTLAGIYMGQDNNLQPPLTQAIPS